METKSLIIGGVLLAGVAYFMMQPKEATDAGSFGSPEAGGWYEVADGAGSSIPVFNFSPTPDGKIPPVQETEAATPIGASKKNAGIVSVGAFDVAALQSSPFASTLDMGGQIKQLEAYGKESRGGTTLDSRPFFIGTGYTATGAAVPVGAREEGAKGSGVFGLFAPIESVMAAEGITAASTKGASGGGTTYQSTSSKKGQQSSATPAPQPLPTPDLKKDYPYFTIPKKK